MDPSYADEKSGKVDHPPAYHADLGYPPVQMGVPAQGVYPSAPGYGAAPYGSQPYPGQAAVTVQPTVYVTPVATHINHAPDYLGYSIFTMLCCCLPLGIAALIYSINTRDANMIGNRDMALRNSRVSRLLNNIALGIGLAVYIISVILFIVSATTVMQMY